MSEVTRSVGTVVSELTGSLRSLQTARDAKTLASVTTTTPPEEEVKAFNRLDKLLNGDEPIRGDVPRGFYFNVKV
ncbi:MAG: hypothetical protein ACKVHL_10270 [Rhodospirillales bacterium]|jgi:hypothetical protein